MPHNHAPRCCCKVEWDQGRCPSCTEHGDLATLGDTNGECPSCHQLPGRTPTDYCQQPDWHSVMLTATWTQTTQPATRTTTPPTQIRDLVSQDDLDALEASRHQRDVRPLAGNIETRRPAPGGTISQPPHYGQIGHHPRTDCRILVCGMEPKREPTPLATPTPGRCTSCQRDYDHTPGAGCRYPASHDHPR